MKVNRMPKKDRLHLTTLRKHLSAMRGEEYWRSLEELADTEDFQEFLHQEFPRQAFPAPHSVNRREFLRLMSASLALAGLSACTRPPNEKIVPYVKAPEEIIPGKPLFFATGMTLGGIATGLLVESHMGRPTKIEGNPEHPASLGATDAFAQASILTLYDPDRSQVVNYAGQISTWNAFFTAVNTALETQRNRKGAGLRLLTETITSPTLAAQIQELLRLFPEAKWHQYEPVGRDSVRKGARLAFGEDVNTYYRFDQAEAILSLEADFFSAMPGSVRYAREYATKRQIRAEHTTMNRLYAVESTPTLAGAMADHRWLLRPGEMEDFARAVAQELGITVTPPRDPVIRPFASRLSALVRDLQKHQGASLILAGEQQSPLVHTLAHAMNHALGNIGHTVIYTEPVEAHPIDEIESLRDLVKDMEAGAVDMLIILGGNPVYNAPADLNFTTHLSKVKLRIHSGLYEDETSYLCHWHVPEAHYLESWGDARAYDGTVTMMQPLIAPLYGGKSVYELLAALLGQPDRSSYDIVRDYWKSQYTGKDFDQFWAKAVHDGFIEGSALPVKSVSFQATFQSPEALPPSREETQTGDVRPLEIIFRPDPTIFDGRFANNGWLQELPKPLTKLTWDNAALLSPTTAERLGLQNEEVVELHYQGRMVRAPIWIMPGQADDTVTVHLGYGRTRVGKVGAGIGFNAYALRPSTSPWSGRGLEIRRTGTQYRLVSTQHHHSMEGRHLVRVGTVQEYVSHPEFVHEMGHDPSPEQTLYPGFQYSGYAWGMTIDLNACVGCNACVIACQAENNIPIVGKEQVANGRAMHWIRIDRYYKGDLENPETYHQPVLCMQCENAPCEVVCPVAATVHSDEGLNDMVYNRCVGTRYCSNNCPYKVRRFNYLQYADWDTPSLKLGRNPDVTVRSRGVMEKCTYCVQRINAARIEAEKDGRKIQDGEILTACQQVCPTEAIIFGDINDPNSRVTKMKAEPLNYGLLTELNTKPRTTYLARLRNPNPEIEME